ncbi:MAG: hypothetical protein LW635_15180 [Microcystis sp. 53598_E5]|jgi:hypothetical protein|nr:hypothetical protein [Microcystis sp. 53598_E5]MCE2674894.1 hypothetical protein [Microcystis sp. 53598_E5]
MAWFLAWLMIFGLWLLLREKKEARQPTTKEIVEKYNRLASTRKAEKNRQQTRRETNISQRKAANLADRASDEKRFQQVERQQAGESLEREKELLSLIRDRKTCERLLKGLRRQYPNESRLWIVEKAIADIERDRR